MTAELDRLRAWKAEALPVISGLQELGRALEVPPGVQITGPVALEAANSLRAEVEAGRRLRAGVETVADAIRGDSGNGHNSGCEGEPDCLACIELDLRALLADTDGSGRG